MSRVCKICGEKEDTHHEPHWLKLPEGCVCNWREWDYRDKDALPPICDEFKGDPRSNCETCEHDKECHTATDAASKEGGK